METKQEIPKSDPPPTLKSNTNNVKLEPKDKIDWDYPNPIILDGDDEPD